MKEIWLREKEMGFLVLFYFDGQNNNIALRLLVILFVLSHLILYFFHLISLTELLELRFLHDKFKLNLNIPKHNQVVFAHKNLIEN